MACVATAICALAFAPGAVQAAAPPLVGAATHPLWSDSTPSDAERELDKLVEAGANVVRIDLSWSSLEQDGRGVYSDWYVDKADAFFAEARDRGLRVIATFWSTPCWASSAPAGVKQDCAGAWWDRDVHKYPPEDAADFARAAAWVAARWKADLAALEIWNEPNCSCWFTSQNRVADYVALLRSAYPSVKAVAPGVPVIGPALLASHGDFLDALYREGMREYVDGVSFRPFIRGGDPSDPVLPEAGPAQSYLHGVPWMREVMVAHGDAGKRLWFTELGWSSCAPGGTSVWCVTQETQARYVAAALRIVRDRWDFVHAVSVYNLRNKGIDPTDREAQMGLLNRDFTPKPAYWAFKEALADLAANPVPPVAEVGTTRAHSLPAALDSGLAPDGAVSISAADVAAPVLAGLALRPRVLRAPRRWARIGFSVSEPAQVTLTLERARGQAACRAGCTRWLDLRGSLVHAAIAGANQMRFNGRLRGKRLVPARYRLSAVARDRAGNTSAVKRIRFGIVS